MVISPELWPARGRNRSRVISSKFHSVGIRAK